MPLAHYHELAGSASAVGPAVVVPRRARSQTGARLSAQEEMFVSAGLEGDSFIYRTLWNYWTARNHPAYGQLSTPFTRLGTRIALRGLANLEQKIKARLAVADLGEDEEDDLINDLASVQLSLESLSETR